MLLNRRFEGDFNIINFITTITTNNYLYITEMGARPLVCNKRRNNENQM